MKVSLTKLEQHILEFALTLLTSNILQAPKTDGNLDLLHDVETLKLKIHSLEEEISTG